MDKWKIVQLSDVLAYEQPTKYIVQNTDYKDAYSIPVLTAGQSFILGYTNETDNIFSDNLPVIIFDDFTTAIKYVDFPFKVKSSAMKILKARKEADIKYLYYYLSRIKVDTELHKRYWISMYSHIQIPLPPLPVQQKIVNVLDRVNTLIEKRKMQIRKCDLLVKSQFIEMFGDPVTDSKKLGTKPLGDSILSIRYGTSTPPPYSDSGFAFIRATNITQGHIVDNGMKFISEEAGKTIEKCKLNGGELIIVRSGVNTGDTCVVPQKYAGHYAGYDIIVEPNPTELDVIFVNELLNTTYMQYVVKPLTARSAQPHINVEQVKSLPIIQPSIELQNRFTDFVRQVDKSKFELSQGLARLELLYKSLMQKCFNGELYS